ncbi:MAG: RseA family anti-sigma factor, partial [Burkholderiales bacterium]|nr:RseA family anti-sigma factor [Burkholderiales bacterium]
MSPINPGSAAAHAQGDAAEARAAAWAEDLSALCDGELGDDRSAGDLAARAARDAAMSGRWLAYHRIGDALRSADLCPARDEHAFLDAFRARLAAEPAVVLAPAAISVPVATELRVRRWR